MRDLHRHVIECHDWSAAPARLKLLACAVDPQEYFPSIESLLASDSPGKLIVNEPVSRSADEKPVTYEAGPPVYPTENELELELIGKRKRESSRPRAITTLKVQVRAGDLRDCAKPIVVGHYAQDAIAGA